MNKSIYLVVYTRHMSKPNVGRFEYRKERRFNSIDEAMNWYDVYKESGYTNVNLVRYFKGEFEVLAH